MKELYLVVFLTGVSAMIALYGAILGPAKIFTIFGLLTILLIVGTIVRVRED